MFIGFVEAKARAIESILVGPFRRFVFVIFFKANLVIHGTFFLISNILKHIVLKH